MVNKYPIKYGKTRCRLGATFDYTFDTSTSVNPGNGEIRLDNVNQSSSLSMFVDYNDDNSVNIKPYGDWEKV